MRMTLLAFAFVNPLLLWGVLMVGVPLLIQWLHRRRYRETPWAAMRFLKAATKSQSRRLRLESLLLVLVRSLIVLLVVLALAEPFLESDSWFPGRATSLRRLVVFDTSLSMSCHPDGVSRSDRAREMLRQIIDSARPGDSFQLVRIGESSPLAVIREPSFDAAEVQREVARIAHSEEFGDVAASLEAAVNVLEGAKEGRTEVSVISDFQRTNWAPEAQPQRERMRDALRRLSSADRLTFLTVGAPRPDNTAVADVTANPALVTVGQPAQVEARIHHFGGQSRSVPVELVDNGQVRQTQSVTIGAFGEATATFVTGWPEPGPHALEVRIAADDLPADDRHSTTLTVKPGLSVLLVNGRESGETLGRATDYVELALAPLGPTDTETTTESAATTTIGVRTIGEAALSSNELSPFDVVFLCDVGFLSEAEIQRLETYVESGGGLVIGLGEQVQRENYERRFNADGAGLMPVEFLQAVGDAKAPQEQYTFSAAEYEHPVLHPFAGNPAAGLTTAGIYRYVRVRVPEGSRARPAVHYSNGDIAFAEVDYGAGRVMLVTTSLDDQWGSWALWPSFLPMMHELVKYAAAGSDRNSGVRVGQPVTRRYPVTAFGMPATLHRPDGRRVPLAAETTDRETRVTFSQTDESGIYRLQLGPPVNRSELIAVHVDPRESDLRTVGQTDLSSLLAVGTEVEFRTDWKAGVVERDDVRTSPLAGVLLTAVLVLMFIEQLMTWKPRLGLIALLTAPLAMGLIVFAGWVGWVVVGVLAVVLVVSRYRPLSGLRS